MIIGHPETADFFGSQAALSATPKIGTPGFEWCFQRSANSLFLMTFYDG
jgi:hypothetical protein